MGRFIPGVLAAAMAVYGFSQQPPVFQAEVHLVNATFLARSSDGSLLTSLGQNDFEVFEDGVPQTIRFFARESTLPLSLGLVIDVSDSQDKFLKQHNRDVKRFLETVLRPSDRALAVCFGNHLRLVSDATNSVDRLMDGLHRFSKGDFFFPEIGPEEKREFGTALYDAIYFTVEEKLRQPGERRRALILFSDGEENSSEHDLLDAIEEAQNADTIIYCVRYTDEHRGRLTARNRYGIRVMKHLSSLTGGADFDGLKSDLNVVFSQIGEELHSLYSIGFTSTNKERDGSFRRLTIQCRRPNCIVRTKSGYYAEP